MHRVTRLLKKYELKYNTKPASVEFLIIYLIEGIL